MSDDAGERLAAGIRSVTGDWKKAKRRADKDDRVQGRDLRRMQSYSPPRWTIKDAAFAVMEQAFNHASNGGEYYVNARQLMYAARPLVLESTGGEVWSDSSYFTQTILKDYLEQRRPAWAAKVVWDARGHFNEPHDGERIGLGGLEVRKYRNAWTNGGCPAVPDVTLPRLLGTCGPKLRFSAVLFIEKEGFDPILEAAQIAERYDLAIMSTKGMPVAAACDVLHALGDDVTVLVVHDFDVSGLNILHTLRWGTRLSRGRKVIDLGFRLEDVEDLPTEEVSGKGNPTDRLRRYGATAEEIAFLVHGRARGAWEGERVELNAMTTGQFIAWLEGKLEAAGVEKVVPDVDTLKRAYRRAHALHEMQDVIDAMEHDQEAIDVPEAEALEQRVRSILAEHPTLPWDKAIWQAAKEDRDEGGEPRA